MSEEECQNALNRLKTAPSFMGGTREYKFAINSSDLLLKDVETLQELINEHFEEVEWKDKGQNPFVKYKQRILECKCGCRLYDTEISNYDYKYCPCCGRKIKR